MKPGKRRPPRRLRQREGKNKPTAETISPPPRESKPDSTAPATGGRVFPRPGVSDEFLIAAGCHHVGSDECVQRYGFRAEGIAIPFRHANGSPIIVNGLPFARVRLYDETDVQKYTQRKDSGNHIYIPHKFAVSVKGSRLFLGEGEMKVNALSEAGFAALGLCGFTGAARSLKGADGERIHELHDELADPLKMHQPAQVVYLGDSDVVLNAQFAIEAAKLRPLLFATKQFPFVERLTVAKLPLGGAKGIDDLRHEKGDAFADCFDAILSNGYDVPAKASSTEIFVTLLKREIEAVKRLVSSQGHEGFRARARLLRSAAQLWNEPGAKLELTTVLCDGLGVSKTELSRLIKDAAPERKERSRSSKSNRSLAGRNGSFSRTPNQWFVEKFPSLSEKYGDPILEDMDEDGVVSVRDIGEDFFAAALGDSASPEAPTVFLPTEGKFYTYLPADGIFIHQRDPALLARLSDLLLDGARQCRDGCQTKALEFRFRDASNLSGVLKKAQGLLEVSHDFFSTDLTKFIPCANGMLRLSDKTLLPFNPSYRRRNKLAVPYDSSAKCPLFLETLMRPALDRDELDLLQRWCGLVLIGENLAQKIVILTGTAGGGKGTFVRVLNGIIGQINLASLRPQLLGERFELGRFLGKTLLYGADVPEKFLNQHGASVLKSLTGYDPIDLEFKNSNERPSIICKFNVVVTCNSRLTVHLEGDHDAWRRRLIMIPYEKPKPQHVIADLDQRILATEASGVLNWMLEGLDKTRAAGWQLHLTAKQQTAVDNLLLESDSHALFAREALIRAEDEQLTVPDCFSAYVTFCNERGWAALARRKFGQAIGDAVTREFGITDRNDINDTSGKAQRGWKGLRLLRQNPRPTDENPSEVSGNSASDTSDTSSPVQPQKIPEDPGLNEAALEL